FHLHIAVQFDHSVSICSIRAATKWVRGSVRQARERPNQIVLLQMTRKNREQYLLARKLLRQARFGGGYRALEFLPALPVQSLVHPPTRRFRTAMRRQCCTLAKRADLHTWRGDMPPPRHLLAM